jgi:hypothetical protein
MKALWGLVRLVVLLVAVQAIREQLSLPPEERTWFGRIGPVPYDFRIPTLERLQSAYWNPDDDRLFSDRVFGVGWAINFAQALRIVRELQEQRRQMSA